MDEESIAHAHIINVANKNDDNLEEMRPITLTPAANVDNQQLFELVKKCWNKTKMKVVVCKYQSSCNGRACLFAILNLDYSFYFQQEDGS